MEETFKKFENFQSNIKEKNYIKTFEQFVNEGFRRDTYMRDSISLLPAGKLSLKTGDVSDGWNIIDSNEKGTLILCKVLEYGKSGEDKYKVLSTADNVKSTQKSYPIGSTIKSHHDQTGRINPILSVIGHFKVNSEGLDEIKNVVNSTKIRISVFK
jgi:hypothetical protein